MKVNTRCRCVRTGADRRAPFSILSIQNGRRRDGSEWTNTLKFRRFMTRWDQRSTNRGVLNHSMSIQVKNIKKKFRTSQKLTHFVESPEKSWQSPWDPSFPWSPGIEKIWFQQKSRHSCQLDQHSPKIMLINQRTGMKLSLPSNSVFLITSMTSSSSARKFPLKSWKYNIHRNVVGKETHLLQGKRVGKSIKSVRRTNPSRRTSEVRAGASATDW